ncbi:hypothetical protein [Polyangium sp. 6x1]|uniref:hypothetical protein n=1 Tax=Polyangium sp. 6x1 TaxID=3042689 RepID=UPI0024831D1D|nr:hypothetical protein [Polyangium sp. 6x1]MDI1449346.1 hypothetical protein [Polyangium sp. 6x1]
MVQRRSSIAFPADDERDLIAHLICKLPEDERHKVRKGIEECIAQSLHVLSEELTSFNEGPQQ